jgi:hypothetical protein
MTRYADYLKLERLILSSNAALSYLESRHPGELKKWSALRRRMGHACPLARGVLKVICASEKNNDKLINSCIEGKWIE